MSSYIQLLSLLFSFIYGIILYILNKLNIKLIKKVNIVFKILIMILYINNISLLYIVTLYKLNNGVLHIYFILMLLLGYGLISVKRCQKDKSISQ